MTWFVCMFRNSQTLFDWNGFFTASLTAGIVEQDRSSASGSQTQTSRNFERISRFQNRPLPTGVAGRDPNGGNPNTRAVEESLPSGMRESAISGPFDLAFHGFFVLLEEIWEMLKLNFLESSTQNHRNFSYCYGTDLYKELSPSPYLV
jgi:hypothetical protein